MNERFLTKQNYVLDSKIESLVVQNCDFNFNSILGKYTIFDFQS